MTFTNPTRSSLPRLSPLRRALLGHTIGVLAAATQLACSGDVTVVLETSGQAPPVDDVCVDGQPPAAPAPTPVEVHDPASGIFLGDTLHLEATVDGERRYVVLAIESSGTAYAVATREDLLGPAGWAPIAEGTHARVRSGSAGNLHVDVIDTRSPATPELVASKTIVADVDTSLPLVFSADQERLFFCARPAAEEKRQLVAVDIGNLTQPGEPQWLDTTMCGRYPDGGFAAHGAIWMVWGKEYDLDVYTVDPQGSTHIADYYYAPNGIHQYGPVLDASSDGSRAAFDPGNDSEFFLVNVPEYTPSGAIAHAYFGIAGPKRLLGVADQIVYLATPDGVRAYDIADIDHPELLPYEASIALGDGLARLIATSERWLAVVDGGGALYLVPRDVSGPVEPLKVYEPRESPVDPPACGGPG